MNRTGQTIDARYLVERRLGTGGMAEVYACEDLQLGRHVALKVLHENLAEDPDVVARFRRESQSAAGLQHPHIVAVYDRGDWDGIPYMAMELVDGVTLKDVIRDQAPLDPVKSIDQISQVLDALRYAHKRGLVHRDIKPQNVLVGPDGDLKVADFGIARAVDDLQMTQTGMIVGTAHYLSPEQASGQPVTPSADLYAVGVVLFEMLTGRMPFDGDQPVTIALKHVNEDPPALSIVNPDVPADLEYVVMRALSKQPEDRFEDAEEFISVLQSVRHRILTGAPVPVQPGLTASGHFNGPQQPTGGWLMPAAGMAVPAGVSPEELQEEAEARRRRRWTFAIVGGLALLVVAALLAYLLFGRMETVPNVVKDSSAKAVQRLEARGFDVLKDYDTSREIAADRVIRQSPSARRRVRHGTQVRIVISTGPRELSVPNVAGLSLQDARTKLRSAGFTSFVDTREASDQVAAGQVIGTDPAAESASTPGVTITIRVSSGPAADGKVTVPDLSGLGRRAARTALEAVDLEPNFVEQDSDEKAGTVIAQNPGRRQRVDSGSTVTVTIARKPEQATTTTTTPDDDGADEVIVPNLQGQTRSAAISALRRRGLDPRVRTVETSDESEDGKVVEQVPNGGRVTRGSAVSIAIGRYEAPSTTTPDEQGSAADPSDAAATQGASGTAKSRPASSVATRSGSGAATASGSGDDGAAS
ncbi:Stk1 family PASTA domain-containing Ser/Thr kinase [Patulibacter sp. S7RM1-6]